MAKTVTIDDWKPYKFKIDMNEAIDSSASNMRNQLWKLSPKGKNSRKDKYFRGWTYKMNKKTHSAIVYNATNYRLTHLLENGHFIVNRKDGKLGWVAPRPHIQKAFDIVAPKFVERMTKCPIVDETE